MRTPDVNQDLLTGGLGKEEAEAEVPSFYETLASLGAAHLVVRVVRDGRGMWGHEVPGLQRFLDSRADTDAA